MTKIEMLEAVVVTFTSGRLPPRNEWDTIAAKALAMRDSLVRQQESAAAKVAADKEKEVAENPLFKVIKEILGDGEWYTIADVAAEIAGDGITVGKIQQAMIKLDKAGEVEKADTFIKSSTGKSVPRKVYRLR